MPLFRIGLFLLLASSDLGPTNNDIMKDRQLKDWLNLDLKFWCPLSQPKWSQDELLFKFDACICQFHFRIALVRILSISHPGRENCASKKNFES